MCGIIAYVGEKNACSLILKGLKRLEYRGYDSSGIAIGKEKDLLVIKEKGNVSNLEKAIALVDSTGNIGIGHTRWATHGSAE